MITNIFNISFAKNKKIINITSISKSRKNSYIHQQIILKYRLTSKWLKKGIIRRHRQNVSITPQTRNQGVAYCGELSERLFYNRNENENEVLLRDLQQSYTQAFIE